MDVITWLIALILAPIALLGVYVAALIIVSIIKVLMGR